MTPPRPTGSDTFATWAKWAHDQLRGLKFNNTPTVKWRRGPDGVYAEAAAVGGAGTTIQLCAVTQLYSLGGDPQNFIGVTPWDVLLNSGAGGPTGQQFYCAKGINSRMPVTETIDGITLSYEYTDDNTRIATPSTGPAERDVCHPRYITYNPPNTGIDPGQYLCFVTRTKNGTGVLDPSTDGQLYYIELHPNRNWAFSTDQTDL